MAFISGPLPRVTIQFCTQCKWMLRAAYFAQELLSTFGTTLGEVSLQPSTGGTFIISLFSSSFLSTDDIQVQHHVLWDRKAEGGFPETKELKRRVRDIIEPGRDLGHVDGKKKSVANINADIAERESTEHKLEDTTRRVEAGEKQNMPRPFAISELQEQGQESERNFTPIDVDGREATSKDVEVGPKTKAHDSLCEDCV